MRQSETFISIKAAWIATICGLITNMVDILWLTGDVLHNGLETYHIIIGCGLSVTPPVLVVSLFLLRKALKHAQEETIKRDFEEKLLNAKLNVLLNLLNNSKDSKKELH